MITENICYLESKAHEVFMELGYAKNTMKAMLIIVRKLIRLHNEQGEKQLNGDIVEGYVRHQETRYQNGEISRKLFLHHKITT